MSEFNINGVWKLTPTFSRKTTIGRILTAKVENLDFRLKSSSEFYYSIGKVKKMNTRKYELKLTAFGNRVTYIEFDKFGTGIVAIQGVQYKMEKVDV